MMTFRTARRRPPRGLQRWLWRAPIWLYRLGLGFLFGRRFLLLNHVGRKTGLPRQAVVEVADYDPQSNSYLIASGFGVSSDWYRNLQKTPDVRIQVGRKVMRARAELLSPQESGEAMVQYARKHPLAARQLSRVMGLTVDGSEESYRRAAEQYIPFVRFQVMD